MTHIFSSITKPTVKCLNVSNTATLESNRDEDKKSQNLYTSIRVDRFGSSNIILYGNMCSLGRSDTWVYLAYPRFGLKFDAAGLFRFRRDNNE